MDDKKEFFEFYLKKFSEFFCLDMRQVKQVATREKLEDYVREYYSVLHTLSNQQILEDFYFRMEGKLSLPDFDSQLEKNRYVTLYHGTNQEFEEIDLTICRSGRDFGRGFYLGTDLEKAKEFSRYKVKQRGSGSPIVYHYKFNREASSLFNSKEFTGVSKEWAEHISGCRTGLDNVLNRNIDFVKGPVADDKVWAYSNLYLEKKITLEKFLDESKPYEDFIQYCFVSQKSLSLVERIRKEEVSEMKLF